MSSRRHVASPNAALDNGAEVSGSAAAEWLRRGMSPSFPVPFERKVSEAGDDRLGMQLSRSVENTPEQTRQSSPAMGRSPMRNTIDSMPGIGSGDGSSSYMRGSSASKCSACGNRMVLVHFALLLTQICWGSAAVVNKLCLSGLGMNPLFYAFLREAFSCPLLYIAYFVGESTTWRTDGDELDALSSLEEPRSPRISGAQYWLLRFVPGVFIFMDQFCALVGLKLASATSSAAWQPSQLIFTTVIGVCLGLEVLTRRKCVGVLLTICGALCLAFLVQPDVQSMRLSMQHPEAFRASASLSPQRKIGAIAATSANSDERLGQLFFCVNSLASSLEVIVWRKILKRSVSPLEHLRVMAEAYLVSAWMMLGACYMTGQHRPFLDFVCPECEGNAWHLPRGAYVALAYAVIFQTMFGYCSQAWALRHADASLASLYATVQPIVATAVSCGLLLVGFNPNDALRWPGREMIGAVLIICGLFVAIGGELPSCRRRSMADGDG
eukprot:TRINITY_DN29543_c0_g1_i2.p1 TRINITY_DN29543_c0_g1~~TRINITY_DN29543_c0_g1_i2.p1  ORF type:complete len:505 (+),score=57.36 TRINITY_DN29543_c0_g1_i2:28-1515(+)